MTDAPGRRAAGSMVWWVAGTVAVLWHVLVVAILRPSFSAPRVSRIPAAAMAYLPSSAGAGSRAELQPDARTIGSPVLFALPTSVGFSRTPARPGPRRLSLQPSGNSESLRTRPPAGTGESILPQSLAREARHAARPSRPAWIEPRLPAGPRTARLFLDAADGVRASLGWTLPVAVGAAAAGPWEVRLRVAHDAAGWPLRVLVEETTAPPAVAAEIVRAAHRCRWPGGQAEEGRIAVRLDVRGGTGPQPRGTGGT